MTPRRLDELEAALTAPSVVAVADMHSDVRAAVSAGLEAAYLAKALEGAAEQSAMAAVEAVLAAQRRTVAGYVIVETGRLPFGYIPADTNEVFARVEDAQIAAAAQGEPASVFALMPVITEGDRNA